MVSVNLSVLHFMLPMFTALLAVPYYPGGSLYARNPPVQPEVSSSVALLRLSSHIVSLLCMQM